MNAAVLIPLFLLTFFAGRISRMVYERSRAAPRRVARAIAKEIREGTPNTPERIETMKRADAVFAGTRRQQRLLDVQAWVQGASHDLTRRAWEDMLHTFRMPGDWHAGQIHAGHLLYFIEHLAELSL